MAQIRSKFYPHPAQDLIHASQARFKVVKAGRRFGKSLFAVNECIVEALKSNQRKVWYLAPLYRQVKEIAWSLFNEYLPKEFILKKNESELSFTLINHSEISLKGTDNADSLVGVGLHFAVLDEAALIKPEVWYQIVRPMLVDTRGAALFIGTPRGLNWFYDLWKQAETDPDFERWEFRTTDNAAVVGISDEVGKAKAEAKSELDRILFRQEYEASFEVISGRPRFDVGLLKEIYDKAHEPLETDSNGFKIWLRSQEGREYVIGVDTSEGLITGDNSSVVVLDCVDYRVVAEFTGLCAPDILALRLRDIANAYNSALVVCEANNHGLVTLTELKKIYTRIYYRKIKDEISDEWTEKIGWQTSSKTKPILISNLDKALRDGLGVPSKDIIQELMTYVIEDDGTTNASEGSKDDRVIALACAVQGYIESNHTAQEKEKEIPRMSAAWIMREKERMKQRRYTPQEDWSLAHA